MNKGVPSRKSLPQIIETFAAFRARHPEALLYLHTEITGLYREGYNLRPLLSAFDLDDSAVRIADQYRYQFDPEPPEHMADVYSSFDVLLNPAMGEGFGLAVLEAQACGVPAIVTDFTAMSEVCGAGWKVGYDRVRTPMRSWQAWPKIDEIGEALEACYELSSSERAALSAQAREHALRYDVERVMEEHWVPALAELEQRFADREPLRIPARAGMKPLIVIPNYMSSEGDLEILGECVRSIRHTVADEVDILDHRRPLAAPVPRRRLRGALRRV